MPEQTLHAFADHGNVERALDTDLGETERILREAERAGLDLGHITAELEREGVWSFCDSYRALLTCIETKRGALSALGT
jgi:transaldolase